MAARYAEPATAAELYARLPESTRAAVRASVDTAPPLPTDTLRQILAGSGDAILAARTRRAA